MDLHVKRFTIRYQGKDYGPGSVIYDVPDKEAKALIDGSNRTIESLPKRKKAASVPDDEKNKANGGSANQEANEKTGETGDSGGLPSVDPAKTVK